MICKIQSNLRKWKVRCISPSCYGKTTHSNNKTPLSPCGHNVTWITSRLREIYLTSLLSGNTYLSNLKNSHTNISVSDRKKNKNYSSLGLKNTCLVKRRKKMLCWETNESKSLIRGRTMSAVKDYISTCPRQYSKGNAFLYQVKQVFRFARNIMFCFFRYWIFRSRNKRISLYDTIENSAILW